MNHVEGNGTNRMNAYRYAAAPPRPRKLQPEDEMRLLLAAAPNPTPKWVWCVLGVLCLAGPVMFAVDNPWFVLVAVVQAGGMLGGVIAEKVRARRMAAELKAAGYDVDAVTTNAQP